MPDEERGRSDVWVVRTRFAALASGASCALAAYLLIEGLITRGPAGLLGEAWVLGLAATVLVMFWFPCVRTDPHGVTARNPLQVTTIPWAAVRGVRTELTLVVETPQGDVECFAIPARLRRPGGIADSVAARVMADLDRHAPAVIEAARQALEPSITVTQRWNTRSLTALAVGAAGVVASLAL